MKYRTLPLNLQYFASPSQGDGAGADAGSGAGEGTAGGGDAAERDSGSGATQPTFDDLLKGGHQAEFDRRLQKAVNTAVGNAQKKWQALTDDKLSEAERLAQMSEKEKQEYLHRKQEKELADREKTITRRELTAEAKNTLAEKKLPVELAEVLNYTDADSCKSSIEVVEKAFQKAVEAGVEERLKGGKPPKKAPDDNRASEEEKVLKLMQGNA